MSSITANSSLYYQLSNLASGNGSAAAVTPTASLANALAPADSSSGSDDAYLLDLSPAAQQYLQNGGGTSATGATASGSFSLSTSQQQAITAILEKYKDAPYTQATFDNIQNDLNAQGLGANQLALQDQAKNFSATALLVDDLNGNTAAADAMVNGADEQTKSSGYMQQIIAQWKQISGNSDSSGDAVAATAGTGAS